MSELFPDHINVQRRTRDGTWNTESSNIGAAMSEEPKRDMASRHLRLIEEAFTSDDLHYRNTGMLQLGVLLAILERLESIEMAIREPPLDTPPVGA